MKWNLLLIYLFSILYLPIFAQEEFINGKRWCHDYYTNRIANDGENLWLATSKGLIKYNKSNGEAYNAALELYYTTENSRFTAIETFDYDGNMTICYSEAEMGPYVFDGARVDFRGTYIHYLESYAYTMSPDGGIWTSVDYMFMPPIDSLYSDTGLIISNMWSSHVFGAIMDMKFDSKNNLWIASYGEYDYLDCVKLESYNTLEYSLPGNKKIVSIAIDKNDNIWYASEEGINYYNQETNQEVCMTKEQYPAMLENRYYANDIDDSGNIWFTSENNLLKWDGSEFTTYTCDGYEEARAMLCDRRTVWVLLKNDKLLKFQNNEFETIDLSPAVTGIKESIAEVSDTKAYVSNGVLYIENAEGINSIEIYDTTGKIITSGTYDNASVQISLPTTLKGVIMVKVNSEVVKVIVE